MIKVWSWRGAIQQSPLEASTKLVLLNLSIYMNEHGQGCYPTIDRQVIDTGLSRRSVITHLQKANDAGFLLIEKHGFAGQKWSNNDYKASYPDIIELNKGSATIAPSKKKGSATDTKCSANNSKKVVQPLHSNTSYNTSINSIQYLHVQTLGVSHELWVEFILHRKKIKKELTDRAFNDLIKQIKLSKRPASEILELILTEGWRSFKASWLHKDKPTETKKLSKDALAG